MCRTACPDNQSLQAVLDESGTGDDELLRHLETCATCQQTLEELAADPIQWEEAAQGVRWTTQTEPALMELVAQLKNDELAGEDDDVSFLQPADKPGLLGVLGPYEVQEEIGRGGMGIVLKALDPALNRVVALKVLLPRLASSASARRRFVREGRAAAAVCHDHIVTVHGVNEAHGLPYLVMQHIPGESLQDRLDRGGPLELEEIVRFGLQIASGLAAAHSQGLIHRDIKPANLLLSDAGRDAREEQTGVLGTSVLCSSRLPHAPPPSHLVLKITDFGLARMVDDALVTQNGVVAGTPAYMAPEQARGDPLDHRADLFSLGSVLFAMCTGVPPFRGTTALAVLRQVIDDAPPSVRQLNPNVPVWMETLLSRLMAKNPADRFQSAAQTGAVLAECLAHVQQPELTPAPELSAIQTTIDTQTRRWDLRVAFLVSGILAVSILGIALLAQIIAPPEYANPPEHGLLSEIYQDFRGASPVGPNFKLEGHDARSLLTKEDGGVRIMLPAKRKECDPVGLRLTSRVKGDFEITASYEIIQADRPTSGHGVGVQLYLMTDTPTDEALDLLRTTRVAEGNVYVGNRMTTAQDGNRHQLQYFQTSAKTGQLRITRTQGEAILWAAEGAGDFRPLCRYSLGAEDLKIVKISAFPGWTQNAVDVRIKDFRVRSGALIPDDPLAPAPKVGPAQEGSASR
jgi:serine/threonine protein kinase